MNNPYFSIIIPTYNRAHILPKALESVSNQTYQGEYEIIVVDDGSTDNIQEILENWVKKEKRLKLIKHDINKGVSSARNTGISLAKGKYILFLDSDDKLLPEALEILKNKVKNHPEGEVFICATLRENKRGKIKNMPLPDLTNSKILNLKKFIEGKLSGCLYLVKSEVLKQYSFPENLKVREDFVIKGLLIALHKVIPVKDEIGIIKDHPERLRYKTEFYLKDTLSSVELLFKHLPQEFKMLYPLALAKAYTEIGTKLYNKNDFKTSLEYFNRAIKVYPQIVLSFKFLKKYLKIRGLNFFK